MWKSSDTEALIAEIGSIQSSAGLDELKLRHFGKDGLLSAALRSLGRMDPVERKAVSVRLNADKVAILEAFEIKQNSLRDAEDEARLAREAIDVTLPTRDGNFGSLHLITKAMEDAVEIFGSMGFDLKLGPDIEDEFHNFTALNVPQHHPSRDMHDTFYIARDRLLRTHTSSVQIRAMKNAKPPFRFISTGRVYRADMDATHTPMFHQMEGVCVGDDVNMQHLLGCLKRFLHDFFQKSSIEMRVRPSFFPFTEPSAEIDIRFDPSKKWLEVLGCGMIHENVFKAVGLDGSCGFAFGVGLDRLAMLKYQVKDLRMFFECDERWMRTHRERFASINMFLRSCRSSQEDYAAA